MNKILRNILILCSLLLTGLTHAQHIPTVPVPQIQNPATMFGLETTHPNPHNPQHLYDINSRNQALIQEVQEHQNAIIRQQQKDNAIQDLIKNGFALQSDKEGTANYYKAYQEINSMLSGDNQMELSKAIFLIENAYHDNKYDYSEFKEAIQYKAELCKQLAKQEKLDINDNMVKNMMIFRLMTDTLQLNTPQGKITHYPIKYNYDDYDSKQNFDSHFVTTLMQTGTGQCHSMPLYYLMIAEELDAEAYWSLSPKHSFIKIQDEKETWFNLELTCAAILSDTHYMNNSYIKSKALRNRLYLEPLDKRSSIAELLCDMAGGYYTRFGMDDFFLQCLNTSLEYNPNSISPLIQKAAYQTRLTLVIADLLEAFNPDILKQKSPEAYAHFEKMHELYNRIDNTGYEEMPDDLYADWLKHIANEKERQEKRPDVFLSLPNSKE